MQKSRLEIDEFTLADMIFDIVTVVNQDILKVDLNQYIAEFKNPDLPIKVVANLPYYITTQSSHDRIQKIPFQKFVVMMQKNWQTASQLSPTPKLMVRYPLLSIDLYDCWRGFLLYCTVFKSQHQTSTLLFLKMIRI